MILPDLTLEKSLWKKGYKYVVGIDEVGRGSWAGPLVAAGVVLPQDFAIPEDLADSKMIKHSQRVKLSREIEKRAIAIAIAKINSSDIDKLGLTKTSSLVFRKVIRALKPSPDFCLIDAFYIRYFPRERQMAVKNGDKVCASIAAASIIAKVYRDNLMRKLHFKYPDYDFAKHKGYGTKSHQLAICKLGLCEIHRSSYNLSFLIK